jgi:hypothetical protein
MKIIRLALIFAVLIITGTAHLEAGILVDHQPHPYGGLASDTLFPPPFGNPVWQLVADNFMIDVNEPITNIVFWGFYNADNPPAEEVMRVRIYDSRASDGLPGLVQYEETFQNPPRFATGRFIGTGVLPLEYRFEATFSEPISLEVNSTYWLEVAQLGDLTAYFRWEYSVTVMDGVATSNSIHADWQNTYPGGPADAAFQLKSPEPTSVVVLLILICSFRKRSCIVQREFRKWNMRSTRS